MGCVVVAQIKLPQFKSRGWFSELGTQGGRLGLLQVLQIGTGMIGQAVLLARWSPDAQTDLFLLLSAVPWLMSAATLVGGLEMALPAAHQRALRSGDAAGVQQFAGQVTLLSGLAGTLAALASGALVASTTALAGLGPGLSLWMGVALGGQVIPAALGGLWRGALVARDRLIRARLTTLVGSIVTATGYALLPGQPAVALPLTAFIAAVLSALLAWRFGRDLLRPAPRALRHPLSSMRQLHPEIIPLTRALAALAVAAGLVHLQALIERAMVLPLGTGAVTSLAVAGRAWDAALTVVVAAGVMPAYAKWAGGLAEAGQLLRWSMSRTLLLSLAAAGALGTAALLLTAWLADSNRGVGWASGAQAAQMALALLPRFVLLSNIQPLVMKHYARGTPWHPVLGAALGLVVIGIGALVLVPRWQLMGVSLATMAGVLPGWVYLVWREWREGRSCTS
jgi:hypothetical protein